MIYDEAFAGDAAAAGDSRDGFSLSEAVDPSDAGTWCWNSVAAFGASEEAVAFLESVFEDRDQDLIQLLHPFECLDSETQQKLS